MKSIVSVLVSLICNVFPYTVNEETTLSSPLTAAEKAKELDRKLANHNGSRNGFEYACYRMCCLPRTFNWLLTATITLMGLAFYVNMVHSIIKIFYELISTGRTFPRFMHIMELLVNISVHWNYTILSRCMQVCRMEVKARYDGVMHPATEEKVILVSETILSRVTKLVMFSIITTLTRIDRDGVGGVSILCVAMLALYYASLHIPLKTFQQRHINLFPVLDAVKDVNVHALIHIIIACFAFTMSMFVIDHTSSHTVLFWITVLFVVNQVKMLVIACMYDHRPNRADAQDENLAVATAVTQIYALILIMRLDSIEPGLVEFYDFYFSK